MLVNYFILLLLLTYATLIFIQNNTRSAKNVLDDLKDNEGSLNDYFTGKHSEKKKSLKSVSRDLSTKYWEVGIFSHKEAKRLLFIFKLLPFIFASFVFVPRSLFFPNATTGTLFQTSLAFLLGMIVSKIWWSMKKNATSKQIDFYLPLVMERIVMAVQSGIDIIPAVRVALEQPLTSAELKLKNKDIVCKFFEIALRLSDAGLDFQESLELVVDKVNSNSLKHAFLHLGLAQKEGGELIKPLRELSDSTQLYFQESIEEEIARMPIKATLPLLLTFSGLIICFLTIPIIQVLNLTLRAMPE